MQKHCAACGMPLEKKEDFAASDENSNFCLYCANPDGSAKSCEEIFEGGVQYFMSQLGGDRVLAEKVTRKNMNQLPYWQDRDCAVLSGEQASDEEFAAALARLS